MPATSASPSGNSTRASTSPPGNSTRASTSPPGKSRCARGCGAGPGNVSTLAAATRRSWSLEPSPPRSVSRLAHKTMSCRAERWSRSRTERRAARAKRARAPRVRDLDRREHGGKLSRSRRSAQFQIANTAGGERRAPPARCAPERGHVARRAPPARVRVRAGQTRSPRATGSLRRRRSRRAAFASARKRARTKRSRWRDAPAPHKRTFPVGRQRCEAPMTHSKHPRFAPAVAQTKKAVTSR